MGRPRVDIDLSAPGAARHAEELSRGGLFVPGEELEINGECDVVVWGAGEPVVVVARVVFADGNGIGVQLDVDAETRARLAEVAAAAPEPTSPEVAWPEPVEDDDTVQDDVEAKPPALELDLPIDGAGGFELDVAALAAAGDGGDGEDETLDRETLDAPTPDPDASGTAPGRNVYARLRGLTLVQQYKVARAGEMHERVALEKIYGKTVWEQLLRNPRITPHEVARIARMGTLPRPQLETIVGNGAWLGVPEIRRALLANTRLTVDMIPRILRLLPKHELKVVPTQLAYPALVRDVARKMLKAMEQ